jgi:hypothetical protein
MISDAQRKESREEVAFSIAQLFKPRWVLSVAANHVALLPYPEEDVAVMRAFQRDIFTGSSCFLENHNQAHRFSGK